MAAVLIPSFLYLLIILARNLVTGDDDIKKLPPSRRERWYSHDLVVEKMSRVAAAAYGEKGKVKSCLERTFPKVQLLDHVSIVCPGILAGFGKETYCGGFVAIASSDRAIILSFSGTDDGVQMVDEILHAVLQLPAQPAGKAHSYFVNVFNAIEKQGLLSLVREAMDGYPQFELWITGHSLGGALASLAAATLVKKYGVNEANLKLVTFGQPRTGDPEWAYAMDKLIHTYRYRVVSRNDIVPHIPFDIRFKVPFKQEMPNIPCEKWMLNICPPQIPPIEHTFDVGVGPSWLQSTGEVWYYEGTEKAGTPFRVCNQTNEQDDCSDFGDVIKSFGKHVGDLLLGIGDACVLKVVEGLGESIIAGFDFSKLTDKVDDCVENKISEGAISIKNIKDLGQSLFGDHKKIYKIDFKGAGDSGCIKLPNVYDEN